MEKCYACDRRLPKSRQLVSTIDGQSVYVGPDCYAKIQGQRDGYQPPTGGPRLYTRVFYLWATRYERIQR